MNVLVIGGAGYIGSHVVKALQKTKHKPIVYDNLSTGHLEAVDECVQFIEGDIRDFELLKHVFGNFEIDAAMHFAACSLVGESMQDPAKYYNNNVAGSLSLLNAMKTAGVDKLIFSSTAAVYGEPDIIPIPETAPTVPTNVYGRTKLAIEWSIQDYARAYGLQYIVLRYFNAAGASSDATIGESHPVETHLIPLMLKAIIKQKPLKVFGTDYPTNDGSCIRDYIHVEDLAQAHVYALDHLIATESSDIFNLGTSSGLSVLEIIQAAQQITGQEILYDIADRRPGDPARLVADAQKAKDILGFIPQHSNLNNIIQTAWNWEKKAW